MRKTLPEDRGDTSGVRGVARRRRLRFDGAAGGKSAITKTQF